MNVCLVLLSFQQCSAVTPVRVELAEWPQSPPAGSYQCSSVYCEQSRTALAQFPSDLGQTQSTSVNMHKVKRLDTVTKTIYQCEISVIFLVWQFGLWCYLRLKVVDFFRLDSHIFEMLEKNNKSNLYLFGDFLDKKKFKQIPFFSFTRNVSFSDKKKYNN